MADTVEAPTFAVLAEKRGFDRPLYLQNLSFAQLVEDVVEPYEKKKRFFIDGVPLSAEELTRIKIVLEDAVFKHELVNLHYFLQKPKLPRGVSPEAYPVRLEGIFRGYGRDVTSQILNVYEKGIVPRLKEAVSRPDVIKGALDMFLTGIKLYSGG